jgi:hypothetical protein
MRRTTPILASVAASIAIAALTAGPALADRGAPGTTFPEQPGTHLQTGCAAVLASAAPGSPMSLRAAAITNGLFADACSPPVYEIRARESPTRQEQSGASPSNASTSRMPKRPAAVGAA